MLHRMGWTLLIAGIVMLLMGVIGVLVSDSRVGPALLFSSILVNSAAITMLQWKKR